MGRQPSAEGVRAIGLSQFRIILRYNQPNVLSPMMAVWPGIAIVLLVIGFTPFDDGLRDALEPHKH